MNVDVGRRVDSREAEWGRGPVGSWKINLRRRHHLVEGVGLLPSCHPLQLREGQDPETAALPQAGALHVVG